MSDSEHDGSSGHEEEVNDNMKVFCRLRPMNKLETSRRSKNCVDLPDDDPRCLILESPLEGEYEYDYLDHVFEEYASQDEVYESSIAGVPEKLLEGYNCAVIAYGQTGSGKTHTMMGLGGGADGLLALTQPKNEEPPKVNPEAQGMILKTTHHVFQQIEQSPSWMEYTIRCSYVEIYLEKILDLLNPGGGEKLSIVEDVAGDEAGGVGDITSSGVRIAGAAELCCFDETDVYGLLARGNACRTMSSTEMNTDSSRSHAIFVMKVEQHDKKTGMMTKSELRMIDLAGSELAASQKASAAQRDASAVQMEAKMINKSLTALQNCIRAQLENQDGAEHSIASMSKQSKLTRFLRPSFGGNCMTWLILTASPSSYNIGETISTIKFGQRVKRIQNAAVVNADVSREVYRNRYKESEQQRKSQLAVLKAVARECKKLKDDALDGSSEEEEHDGPIWDTIEELLATEDGADELDFNALVRGQKNVTGSTNGTSGEDVADDLEKARKEIQQLREQLESISKARDTSENLLSELQSEVAVLRSQNEHLIADKTKDLEELINAKNELQIMSQRKIEVEHNFRTSQFRENEAIVFLRTFRRFYKNVLRDRAAQGSGSIKAITQEISEKVPGAIDLSELVDADRLLLEAGLIEEHEIQDGSKPAPVYVPSKGALIRSATAAKKAAKEMGALEKKLDSEANENRASLKREDSTSAQTAPVRGTPRSSFQRRGSAIRRSSFTSIEPAISEEDPVPSGEAIETSEEPAGEDALKQPGSGADAGAGSPEPGRGSSEAGLLWDQTGVAITNRQKLLATPAGRFAIMQDKNMERELVDMADRCVKLEQELKEERATVEILSGRAGGANKKKLAQEAIQLRQQIEKKTQNLMAISWKMNELNLINKSYNEKMVNREQHVVYLEENYVELQNRNRMIIEEQQEAERKLRDELNSVRKVLGGMSVRLWQYKEENVNEERALASRILIPVHGGRGTSQIGKEPPERRLSDAESEPSLEIPQERDSPVVERVDASTQTDEVKEEPVAKEEIGVQTDEVLREDVGTMTEESLGTATITAPSIDSVDASVQTSDQEAEEKTSSAGKVAAAGILGAATGAAAAAAISTQTDSEQSEGVEPDDVAGKLRAGVAGASVGISRAAITSSATDDDESEELESEGETDFAGKLAASGGSRLAEAAVSTSHEDEEQSTESSDESDSDYETDDDAGRNVSEDGALDEGDHAVGSRKTVNDPNEEEVSEAEHEEIGRGPTHTRAPNAAGATSIASLSSSDSGVANDSSESDDDITALTEELAADGTFPQSVSVDSQGANDDDEIIETDLGEKQSLLAGKGGAAAGISGAAVISAAASVAREEEEEKSKESSPNKDDNFLSKNIFTATVMSVLNRGGNDADKKQGTQEKSEVDENEIESYRGNGHSPKNPERNEDYGASSRDEWAAARDDFDSIFEETAEAVKSSSSRRRPSLVEEDPEISNREFMDIAAKIGHKNEEEIVTMGSSMRQMRTREVPSPERKPWEKGEEADKRKPWEKSAKRDKEDGSLGSSIDITKDNWYGASDDESDDSYRFETHVLNREQKEEKSAHVKFTDSTIKRDTSEDEFDKMMNATQAALGAAEEEVVPDVEEDVGPEHDALSLSSKEEALFTGGRPNDFQPRRSVERPKIRAGVLKEEKKSSRDKSNRSQSSRSQLSRKKSASRRRLGDDKSKRKKKDEKKKKRSSRDLARAKSERYPERKRDKEPSRRAPRRKSTD